MANNLKDHLKEVADAIRAKKGTSDLINPQDFATEIEGISGSGGESGDWELTYYKIVNADEQMVGGLFLYGGANIVNCAIKDGDVVIANMGVTIGYDMISKGEHNDIVAIVSAKLPIKDEDAYKPYSLKELFVTAGIWDAISPMLLEITKEEYYNLNA
jgi:hypothetical protein